jgi:acetyl esterase/lipase
LLTALASRSLALLTQQVPIENSGKIVALGLQYPGLDLSKEYDTKLATLEDPTKVLPPPWASKLFLRCFLPKPYDTVEARRNPFISPGLADDDDLQKLPPTYLVTAQYDHFREVGRGGNKSLVISAKQANQARFYVPGK